MGFKERKKSTCTISTLLVKAYKVKRLRKKIKHIALKLEGGDYFSQTVRKIFKQYHHVTVGMYSYSGVFVHKLLPEGTIVGNYCSISPILEIHRRNHPVNRISQHPFFYNRIVSPLKTDTIENIRDNPLIIGNDVFLGQSSVILPSCKKIGDGAIVGGASVVTKDVEPYTIVAGNPAKFIRRRFPKEIEDKIIESNWWTHSLSTLAIELPCFINDPSVNLLGRFKNYFSLL